MYEKDDLEFLKEKSKRKRSLFEENKFDEIL
jgi:hypothetical protein